MTFPRPIPLVPFLLAATVGCGTYRTFDLPDDPAHARESRQEQYGLAVAAQLVVDPEVSAHYFGPELPARGYFAVILTLENRGGGSFQIERDDITLILEGGQRFKPIAPPEVLRETKVPSLPPASLALAPLIFPPFVAHARAQEYNFQLARNLQRKSLAPFYRIEPGDPTLSRVLFFKGGDAQDGPATRFDSSVLEFVVAIEGSPLDEDGPAPRTETKVGMSVNFTISLTRKEI